MSNQENLNKRLKEARNEYYETLNQMENLRKAYEAARVECDKHRVKMDVAIYEYHKANGTEYTIKLGSSTFDVVDVKPNGTFYEVTYKTKTGVVKTVNRTIMPQMKAPVVPDNVQYEF